MINKEMKRTITSIILFLLSGGLYLYLKLTGNPDLFIFKILLGNTGFLNAHIVRKLAFGKVDWSNDEQKMLKILIIVMYGIFIYIYAIGG